MSTSGAVKDNAFPAHTASGTLIVTVGNLFTVTFNVADVSHNSAKDKSSRAKSFPSPPNC
ncbi:hypothetical protein D3C85_1882790 [compost metagenome]